ncbi:hypothetical protein HYV83_00795 [Candidatus Woesearchaeota archaeon]|nr:hypothetical protein [Candidatus Woesearchaeota archaeon]
MAEQTVSSKEAHIVEIAGGVNETQLEGIAIALAKAAEGRTLIVSCKGGKTDGNMADRHIVLLELIRAQGVMGQHRQYFPKKLMAGVVYLVPNAPAVGQSYMFITSGGSNGHKYMVPAQLLIQEGYSALEKNAAKTLIN